MPAYSSKDGDVLDDICVRHYGSATDIEEQVLDANPGLADQGPVFVSGIMIELPLIINTTPSSKVIRLWD